jgi:HSP20 family molecular chaperone IbpA
MKYKNGMLVITIDKQKEEKNKFNITIDESIEDVE